MSKDRRKPRTDGRTGSGKPGVHRKGSEPRPAAERPAKPRYTTRDCPKCGNDPKKREACQTCGTRGTVTVEE